MGGVKDHNKFIQTKLYIEMQGLSPDAKNLKYHNEIKTEIIDLLSKCYSNNFTDSLMFYDESFKSLIGFYEADLLLLNLFFEKESVHIVNYLMKSGALNDVKSSKLSVFTADFFEFINSIYSRNSSLKFNDEIAFIQSRFNFLITEMTELDWHPDRQDDNPLIRKFVEWIDTKLDADKEGSVLIAFLIFIKVWNSVDDFSTPFNNTKAIRFYYGINTLLERRLYELNTKSYVAFIKSLEKVNTNLFVRIDYRPLLDDEDSYKYRDGYTKQRAKNKELFEQALIIEDISTSLSFFELIKSIYKESPKYLVDKYEKTILEKIEWFHYPSEKEIEEIRTLESNINIDKLKNILFEKLYIYESA